MATITCKCGAVQIEFYTKNDLFRLECCCHDCSAALWYANKRGGPPFPKIQCVDSSWFPNDFKVVKGENELGAFVNFENADTTRFHCTVCWSVLFGDHTAYAKKLVVTQVGNYKEFEGLKNAELMSPQARHFLKDLSKEQLATLPIWEGDPANVYQGVAENWMACFPAVLEAGHEGTEMNAQILLAKIGGAFVPTGEARLTEGHPTLMQQLAGSV
ncbi:MAG: hypothetical protein EXR86_06375 [Gammaproteobacteria bacterium]|nr:hypothetical protein [Gammaproteobacteria bacterium]